MNEVRNMKTGTINSFENNKKKHKASKPTTLPVCGVKPGFLELLLAFLLVQRDSPDFLQTVSDLGRVGPVV